MIVQDEKSYGKLCDDGCYAKLIEDTVGVIQDVKGMKLDLETKNRALYWISENFLESGLHIMSLISKGFKTDDKVFFWDSKLYPENETYREVLDALHRSYLKMIMIPTELGEGTFADYERRVLKAQRS